MKKKQKVVNTESEKISDLKKNETSGKDQFLTTNQGPCLKLSELHPKQLNELLKPASNGT